MLRSSACVSGTEAGGAVELPSEYNAALESVWGYVKEASDCKKKGGEKKNQD